MAKKIKSSLKIMAPGGQATPAPPLGPALGAAGVNPGQFIQQFNEKTRELNGKVIGCIVNVYDDRSFDFELKSSPASVLIKEAAKINKGSGRAAVVLLEATYGVGEDGPRRTTPSKAPSTNPRTWRSK